MKSLLITVLFSIFSLFTFAQNKDTEKIDFHLNENAIHIQKWLDYYSLKALDFKILERSKRCIDCPPTRKDNPYYLEFSNKHDTDTLIDVDYSPSKKKYVSLGISIEYQKGIPYFYGWGCSQDIYLTDRTLKHHNLILRFSVSYQLAEGIFWKDENTFFVVGVEDIDQNVHFIYAFDLLNGTVVKYGAEAHLDSTNFDYFDAIYLPEKGIILN